MSEKSAEEKLKIMSSVLQKMEDIQNTQKSLIEKVSLVEIELFEIKSPDLDEKLGKVSETAKDSFETIKDAKEKFTMKYNALNQERE